MKFVKLFTPVTFDREGFADMLKLKMNVRARAVEDGVILDRDAFNATPAKFMPVWAWNCRKDINNSLRTRPALPAEWPELNPGGRYLLCMIFDDNTADPLERADGLDYLTEQADMIATEYSSQSGFLSVVVLDRQSGEIMYTAN